MYSISLFDSILTKKDIKRCAMGNIQWSSTENAIIIGVLPKYRYLLNQGNTKGSASTILAEKIIKEDLEGFFAERINNVKNPISTVAQHIQRMDDVASGKASGLKQLEKVWNNVLP